MPAWRRRGRVGAHEQVAVVGDRGVRRPGLLTGHHVLVAVEASARAQRGQVGAGVGLGEPLAPHDLAAHDRREQRRLLLVGAVGQDRRPDPVDVHVLRAPRLADRPQLLAEDDVLPRGRRPPAVLRRPVRRQPAALGESTVEDLRVGDVLGRSELTHRRHATRRRARRRRTSAAPHGTPRPRPTNRTPTGPPTLPNSAVPDQLDACGGRGIVGWAAGRLEITGYSISAATALASRTPWITATSEARVDGAPVHEPGRRASATPPRTRRRAAS